MYRFAYITGDMILVLVWIILFIKRKDLRLEMLVMSKLSLFWIAISFVFFTQDFYTHVWRPEALNILHLPFGVLGEDILYTFAFGGIAAVLYEELLGKKHLKSLRKKNTFTHYLLFPVILFVSLLVSIRYLGLNPYYATYIGFVVGAIVMWIGRRDLIVHSFLSGIFLGTLYFFLAAFVFLPLFPHVVETWWKVSQLSGILFLGVPLEEILWAFYFGVFVGPSYEFLMGLKEQSIKKRKK